MQQKDVPTVMNILETEVKKLPLPIVSEYAVKEGRNPFPITALEHPTDTYASRGVVEHLDLTGMLRSIGVTAQDVLPLEIVYNSKEN